MEALSQALEENALPAERDPAHELIAAVTVDLRATLYELAAALGAQA